MHSGPINTVLTSHYLDWDVAISKINKYIEMGDKFLKVKQYFQALENYDDAKKLYVSARTPDRKILVTILCKLTICEIELNKNYDQARSYIDEILAICAAQNSLIKYSSHLRKSSRPVIPQTNSELVEATVMDKNEISESYYKIGKICLEYLDDNELAKACFISALSLLDCKNPETTPLFYRNTIHLPILKIDFELTKLLVKNAKLAEAINAIENGILTLNSIIDSTPIAIYKEEYRKLCSKFFIFLKQISPEHKLLESSIFETVNPLFSSKKHQTISLQKDIQGTKNDGIDSTNISFEARNRQKEDGNEIDNAKSSTQSMCRLC